MPQFEQERALIVVSAKERGLVYVAHQGEITELAHVEEHPPSYSDDEGFFFSGNPAHPSGGYPKEANNEHDFKQYINAIEAELSKAIAHQKPDVIYIFEPAHLAGKVKEHIKNPNHIPVHLVKTGNHLDAHPHVIIEFIAAFSDGQAA